MNRYSLYLYINLSIRPLGQKVLRSRETYSTMCVNYLMAVIADWLLAVYQKDFMSFCVLKDSSLASR